MFVLLPWRIHSTQVLWFILGQLYLGCLLCCLFVWDCERQIIKCILSIWYFLLLLFQINPRISLHFKLKRSVFISRNIRFSSMLKKALQYFRSLLQFVELFTNKVSDFFYQVVINVHLPIWLSDFYICFVIIDYSSPDNQTNLIM